MPALINCLQKATGKFEDDAGAKHDVFDHLIKRGLINEVNTRLAQQDRTVHEVEVAVIQEKLQQARADVATVEAALKAPAPPTAQASAPRPVDRDVATDEAFARMRQHPEQKAKLDKDIKAHYERVRAETKAMEAELPPVEEVDVSGQVAQLEAKETLAQEDLERQREAALQKSSEDISQRYAERILAATDPVKKRDLEREARSVATVQKRGINNRFAEKRRALTRDFQRQTQMAQIKGREAQLAATKEGARTEKELRKIRAFSELNALVRALPPEVRERIGGHVTLATLRSTGESMGAFMAGRIEKIDVELEKHFQKEFRESIEALLAARVPKKTKGGVVKSTIGADAQDVVDRVAIYAKMSSDEVAAQYALTETALSTGFMPDGAEVDSDMEGMLALKQFELSTFGAMDSMSAGELEAAYDSLKQTIKDGRSAWGAIEEARLAEKRRKVAEFIALLPAATSPEIAASNENKLRNFLRTYIAEHYTTSQFIGKLAPGLSFIDSWHNESRRADGADIDFSIDVTNRLQLVLRAALGQNSALAVGKALTAMGVRNVPAPGGMVTQLEAIQYLFTWGQAVGKERMTKQGWLPEHIKALEDATNHPAATALKTFMLAEYDRIYQLTDPVYVRHNGMHLPKTKNYAPMYHHPVGTEKEMDPLGGVFATSGLTPRATKARVKHNAPLKAVSALDVFNRHVSEMGHWIAFADIMRDMRGVINDRQVKMALQKHLGEKGASDFSTHLDTLARGGVARAAETSVQKDLINFFLAGTAQTALAFNPRTILVQAEAGLRWMLAIPPRRWIPALLNRTWMTNLPEAWNSPTIQRRIMEGMNPLMRQAMQSTNMTPGMLVQAARWGFVPMKYMDALGTTMTAAIVYSDALAQGMSHEQALDAMDDAVARYAQPISVASKSRVEAQGGVFWKTMFLFMSDLRLKSALAIEAIDDLVHGRNVEKALGTLTALQIMGVLTQMLANVYAHALDGDDDDDDDYWLFNNLLPVMATAPLAGLWGLGTVLAATASWALGAPTFAKEEPITAAATRAKRAWSGAHFLFEDRDWNDQKFVRELDNIAKTLGMIPGVGPVVVGPLNVYKTAAGAARQLEE